MTAHKPLTWTTLAEPVKPAERTHTLTLAVHFDDSAERLGYSYRDAASADVIAAAAANAKLREALLQWALNELQRFPSRAIETACPAACAPDRVGDDSVTTVLGPSPPREARQGDLRSEGPAGETDAAAAPTAAAKKDDSLVGPSDAELSAALSEALAAAESRVAELAKERDALQDSLDLTAAGVAEEKARNLDSLQYIERHVREEYQGPGFAPQHEEQELPHSICSALSRFRKERDQWHGQMVASEEYRGAMRSRAEQAESDLTALRERYELAETECIRGHALLRLVIGERDYERNGPSVATWQRAESRVTGLRERYEELARAIRVVWPWLCANHPSVETMESISGAVTSALDSLPRPVPAATSAQPGEAASIISVGDLVEVHDACCEPSLDAKPTGDPARDAQEHGGACWLIERHSTWLAREPWKRSEIAMWITDPAAALAFPTQAEAEMFAMEYLSELDDVTAYFVRCPRTGA